MSGRSAYVRKKITESNKASSSADNTSQSNRRRAKSSGSVLSGDDGSSFSDHMMPNGTGYGTTNARFLKFSDPSQAQSHESESNDNVGSENRSSGSNSEATGKRDALLSLSQYQGPMPDYAYARARRPVLRTEDVSGIERSEFRNTVDKTSDGIRKGITKAFTLGKKKKKDKNAADGPDQRAPPLSGTMRAQSAYDDFAIPDMPPAPNLRNIQSHEGLDGQNYTSPPPSAKLPPIPTSTAPPVKRWLGGGRPAQKWNKLRKDPELWDPNGDVLVYFGRKDEQQGRRSNPSFRVSSHIIEATESRYLITMLNEGSTEEDYDNPSGPSVSRPTPPLARNDSYNNNNNIANNLSSMPSVSEENNGGYGDLDGQISYEMYFPAPVNMNKSDAHRHAITTRNVFALLYHASLVGLSLSQALSDLLARLDAYMEPDADNVGLVLNYLCGRAIDDARGDPETAVSMLAWSESPEVRWEEGWREAFLHCAGMYSRGLDKCADFRHLTPITRALLERACLETQLRVQAAEERLATFTFEGLWPSSLTNGNNNNGSSSKAAADRLQQFLKAHYAKTYGIWPPPTENTSPTTTTTTDGGEEIWLTRTIARALQRDFGALYDYLVNRDIIWDESETRSSRKWMMISEGGDKSFEADTPDLPLTDILIEYDNRMRFPHIPHPYPLVPESVLPLSATSSSSSSSSSATTTRPASSKKDAKAKHQARQNQAPEDRTLDRRIQLAYTEATNIYALGSSSSPSFSTSAQHSDLIESYARFEKSDHQSPNSIDPSSARRARWVLIYAILQTLATVSVDAPCVRYQEGVAYHLSPRLKGARTPPWKGVVASFNTIEASHELSHCWVAPRSWISSDSSSSVSAASAEAAVEDGFGAAAEERGEESSDADTGGDHHHDPIARMVRRQQQHQQQQQHGTTSLGKTGAGDSYPHNIGTHYQQHQPQHQTHPPPPPPSSTASRSSNADWPTVNAGGRGGRSVWSSSGGDITPTMWGGSSALSVSNYSDDAATTTNSSVRTPISSYHPQYYHHQYQQYQQQQHQHQNHHQNNHQQQAQAQLNQRGGGTYSTVMPGSGNNHNTTTTTTTIDDATITKGGRQQQQQQQQNWPTRSHSHTNHTLPLSLPPTTPLDLDAEDFFNVPSSLTGRGEENSSSSGNESTNDSSSGEEKKKRRNKDATGLGPLIRDFDELDLVIEEGVYGHHE